MRHARCRLFITGALLAAMGLVLAGLAPVIAQDEDATPVPDAVPLMASYSADIHAGTCDDLSPDPVFRLADVMMDEALGATPPAIEVMGAESAIPVAVSVTVLDVAVDDILAADHAIHVALGPDDLEGSLVCGDIGGRLVGNDLMVGLQERDSSGATGIAWLNATAEDQTTVTLFVAQGLAADVPAPTVATPEPIEAATPPAVLEDVDPATPPPDEVEVATPAPDEEDLEATPPPVEEATPPPDDEAVDDDEDEVGEGVTVEAVDIDFNPNSFTIAANADVPVTLVNNGDTLHTFTIDELDINEELDPGEQVEITINAAAGEYTYYCTVPGHREGGQEGIMTVE